MTKMEQMQRNNRLVNFILRNIKEASSLRVGAPLTDMGDAWNLLQGLGVFVERIIFYDKADALSFCSIQWVGVGGMSKFIESKGETCTEALCRNIVKALGGDDVEILGETG